MPEVGDLAISGVGIAFPIVTLIMAFSSLMGMGGAPRAAIKMGENNDDEAENIIGNSFMLLLLISIVLMIIFLPFIMKSTESLLNISLNASLLKYGGDQAVGAMTIITSVMQMLFLPLTGLTQGAQPIISYNYGARNNERVKQTFKYLLIASLTYTFVFWAAIMLFPQAFVLIFNDKPELTSITIWAIRIYMGSSVLLGIQVACQQTFVAVRQAKISMALALLRKIILLIPLIFILPRFLQDKVFAVFFLNRSPTLSHRS